MTAPKHARISSVTIALFMLFLCIVGCESGDGTVTMYNSDFQEVLGTADVTVRRKLHEHVLDRYLWYRDIPDLELSDDRYSDLNELLEALRKRPEDRFSGFVDSRLQQQRVDQGYSRQLWSALCTAGIGWRGRSP